MREKLERLIPKLKEDPELFAEKFSNVKFFSYQSRLMRDPSKRISARFCRQSGKTFTFGNKILHFAITNPGVTVIVVAPSLRQSRNVRDKMEPLINAMPRVIQRLIFKKIQRETLYLRNGSVIKFFPNSPDMIRGETADMIYVDEAAMFRDDRYLFNQVLKPMLSTTARRGYGYLYVSSTPKNKKSMFYDMCQEESGFSHHHVTWREPVAEGLISREFIEEMQRELLPQEFQMEFEAEFVEDADSWLPYDLIMNCVDAFLDFYRFEDCPHGIFYIGVDFGKHQDYSVVAVIQREGETLRLVHLKRFELGTAYASVIGYVKSLCDRWKTVYGVYTDVTGVGDYITEDMQRSGIPGVKGVLLSLPTKEAVMTFLKQRMINRKVAVPYSQDRGLIEKFIAELNVEKFEITKEGRVKFTHPVGTHDDMLWAFALAVYASKEEKPAGTLIRAF